jgi:hypothetical protein
MRACTGALEVRGGSAGTEVTMTSRPVAAALLADRNEFSN